MLHLEGKKFETKTLKANVASVDEKSPDSNDTTQAVSSLFTAHANTVVLATAVIGVESKNQEKITLRALIDQGSQSSFVSENALQTLQLKRKPTTVQINGIGDIKKVPKYCVELTIYPRFKSEFSLHTNAIVLDKLTSVSTKFAEINKFDHLNNLLMADPSTQNNRYYIRCR